MTKRIEKDAKLTGWPKNLVAVWNKKKTGEKGFVGFKAWFSPKYKNMTAEEVWVQCGGELPKK